MLLYDGYAEPPTYVYENIFANAIWSYDLVTNRLYLEKLSHWTLQGDSMLPLPENSTDPTPYDRHVYSCIIFSASKNRAYLWSGANKILGGDEVGTTWTYGFQERAWRQIPTTQPFNVYEQACSYDPFLEKMILFGGASRTYGPGDRTYHFDLNTETWTDHTPVPSPAPRSGQTMAFDTRRRVTWMFGGAPFGSAGNELWSYDAAANVWSQVARTSPWPTERRFASMAYDSRRDVFLLWGGVTASDNVLVDTWLFHPSTERWQRLDPPAPPDVNRRYYSEDLDYDPVNDVFVLNLGGTFWLYRTPGSSGETAPVPAMRIVSANPGSSGPTFELSLTQDSEVSMDIFDARGRRVGTLPGRRYSAGIHAITWSGHTGAGKAPSGVYVARLKTPGHSVTTRFTLVR